MTQVGTRVNEQQMSETCSLHLAHAAVRAFGGTVTREDDSDTSWCGQSALTFLSHPLGFRHLERSPPVLNLFDGLNNASDYTTAFEDPFAQR